MNDFYTHSDTATKHTTGRAANVNDVSQSVETAFDKLPSQLSLDGDYATYAGDTTGVADVYVVTLPQTLASYVEGLSFSAKITTTNTGPSTMNVDSVGAVAIKRHNGDALSAGDLTATRIYDFRHDGTNIVFHDSTDASVSAAAAAASAVLTAADVVSTNADVVSTGNDVTSTNADVVTTNADVVLTGLDVVSTNADVVSTNADVVSTGNDVTSTNADVVSTGNDVTATNADVVSTNADVVTTNAVVVSMTGTSSTTSLLIEVASKAFTVASGLGFAAGDWVLVSSDANPDTNYMHGPISSYTGTTLTVNVDNIGGSGTLADWTIRRSGTQGATGATGATGPAGAVASVTGGVAITNSGDATDPVLDVDIASGAEIDTGTEDAKAVTPKAITDSTVATAASTTTFTNKTLDANGTGNSLSNVDVADLAAGTDGELITWDAAGVAATVGVGTAAQVLTSNGPGAAPTMQDAAGGKVVQIVHTSYASTLTTGTTPIPQDNTKPQNTEGDEKMTQAITPTSATNKLVIEVMGLFSPSAASTIIMALFQDTTADALSSQAERQPEVDQAIFLYLKYEMTAGTTSSTTFKVRAGPHVAATVTFGGVAGGALFASTLSQFIRITEIES